ncbi:MAG TPA: DUF1697 domain-containing protein [Verrucomicrobiae bacterium]|nr:DUF1697 domain-containing protein [Verrucomicrobiae bacterium]
MIYVALLRGINVGGKNKVEMKRLKETFERIGTTDVVTYINSGNIIFKDTTHTPKQLVTLLEKAIAEDFGFAVKVLIRDKDNIKMVAKALSDKWVNDATMKCDVLFLWEDFDTKEVLDLLTIKPDIDDVKYVPGAVLWRVDRPNVTRSGLMKIFGTEVYAHVTIRNCNTARKLATLMNS